MHVYSQDYICKFEQYIIQYIVVGKSRQEAKERVERKMLIVTIK